MVGKSRHKEHEVAGHSVSTGVSREFEAPVSTGESREHAAPAWIALFLEHLQDSRKLCAPL